MLDAKIESLNEAITNRVADALSHNVPGERIAAAVAKMEADLADLHARRQKVEEHEERKRERAGRRARLSPLTRASLTLVNSSLEQRKTIFALLDAQATMTQDGLEIAEIAGILREDLPHLLGVDQRPAE